MARSRKLRIEQGELMDVDDPKHKKLIKLLKSYKKKKDERDDVKGTMKEAMDAAAESVIVEMKALGLTKFRHSGFEVNISEGKTILTVKTVSDDSAGNDDDEMNE